LWGSQTGQEEFVSERVGDMSNPLSLHLDLFQEKGQPVHFIAQL
jgi:hypothetical protein